MSEKDSTLIDPRIAKEMIGADKLLQQIYTFYASQEFLPSVDSPVSEGATVIGTMSRLEKSIYSVVKAAMDEVEEITKHHKEIEATCDRDCEKCPVKDDSASIGLIIAGIEPGREMLSAIIRRRLGAEVYDKGDVLMAVDYQIVVKPKQRRMGMIVGGEHLPPEIREKLAGLGIE